MSSAATPLALFLLVTTGAASIAYGDLPPPQRTAADAATTLDLAAFLQQSLDASAPVVGRPAGRALHSEVVELYEATGMQPLWTEAERAHPRAAQLLAALAEADTDGLVAADYQPELLAEILAGAYRDAAPSDAQRFAADRALSEAAVRFAHDIANGRVDPPDVACPGRRAPVYPTAFLARASAAGDVRHLRERLARQTPADAALRAALADYRQRAAGAPEELVPPGAKLEVGTREDIVRLAALERRLRAAGDLDDDDRSLARAERHATESGLAAVAVYGERLAAAVRRFQQRHGLGVDGIVGPRTMRELNRTADDRVRQLVVNLERLRWLPRSLERRRIVVNVPSFSLTLIDDGAAVAEMAVVVGRRSWPTPIFSDRVEYIVLNPYWNVPKNIARDELLPKVRRDAEFLEREGYVLTDAAGAPLDLAPEELERVSHRTHFLRQLPGPGNALGTMKFLFPNRWDVYLHDTPSRSLFRRAARAFSHGCIRVERPRDLAAFLVAGDPQWSMPRLDRTARQGPDKWMRLAHSVPIDIVYFTATLGTGGVVFHHDLYDHDAALEAALQRASGSLGTAIVSRDDRHTASP